MLLDCVIFGVEHEECQRKLLSKGEDLIHDRTLEIKCEKEVTDASCNEVFQKDKSVDVVQEKFNGVKLNPDYCYSLWKTAFKGQV